MVQVLFITQSGAEGLNLKNVRDVHIIEPYWNRVRVDQVIGRARRVGSHLNLPPEQHTVNVYEYHTIFPKDISKQSLITSKNEKIVENYIGDISLNNDLSSKITKYVDISDFILRLLKIIKDDNNKSTDQSLYSLSLKKKSLSESFLQLTKNIAIDCRSNLEENTEAGFFQNTRNIICFDSKERRQKHEEILSRNEYAFDLQNQNEELKESIQMSVDVYLVDKVQHFNLPIKYFSLQNISKQKQKSQTIHILHDNQKKYLHNDFLFWSKPSFQNHKIMLCKSDKLIINFYQYIGLDPLHASFINPLLRKSNKITDSFIVGKYQIFKDDLEKNEIDFNAKYITLNLGNSLNEQKAYSVYLFLLQDFIHKLNKPMPTNIINSTKLNEWLYEIRKEIRLHFKFKFQFNGNLIEKNWIDFNSNSFHEAITKPIVDDKIYLQTYLLFLYQQLKQQNS